LIELTQKKGERAYEHDLQLRSQHQNTVLEFHSVNRISKMRAMRYSPVTALITRRFLDLAPHRPKRFVTFARTQAWHDLETVEDSPLSIKSASCRRLQ
jgi:hypothetical protein